jgi:hypothetical protein
MHSLVCKIKTYIQPFERVLALKELQALSFCEPKPVERSEESVAFKIKTDVSLELLRDNLTYLGIGR